MLTGNAPPKMLLSRRIGDPDCLLCSLWRRSTSASSAPVEEIRADSICGVARLDALEALRVDARAEMRVEVRLCIAAARAAFPGRKAWSGACTAEKGDVSTGRTRATCGWCVGGIACTD